MRRPKHGNQPQSDSDIQAWLAVGYVCARTEAQLDTIRAKDGVSLTKQQLSAWVAEFFLSEARRPLLDGAEHLPEVRGGAAEGHALGAGAAEVYVHTRRERTLSAKALKAISDAQKKRWAKAKREKRAAERAANGKPKLGRPAKVKQAKGPGRGFVTPAGRKKGAAALKGYWASMTKEQRQAEMARRRAVTLAKQAADKKKVESAAA